VSNSKPKLGKKKQGLTLGWPPKKRKKYVHRNVASFPIFYGKFLLLKGHLNENMNVKYAKIVEVFFEKKLNIMLPFHKLTNRSFRN
jgi:hypothetical protein